MKILITGASSYVGARLYFDLRKDFETVGTYNNSKLSNDFFKLDTTNYKEVNEIISKEHPDIIVHAAANANARWCNANKEAALVLNEKATKYVVDAANKIGAQVIFISSYAAVKPTDIYGQTKYNSEQFIKQTNKGWIILRPSLILGFSPNTVNDRPFNRLLKNLDEGTPAVYDTSWKFQTSYVGQISKVIKEVINKNITNKIIPVATEDIKSRYITAKDILTPFNIKVTPIDIKDKSPLIKQNLNILEELGLPFYTYEEIIKKIIEEIKNRKIYKLS